MAVDHLVGTGATAGEDDAFPVDPIAFVISAAIVVVATAVLFAFVVRPAAGDDPRRAARKAFACSLLALLAVPVLFLGLPFPLAGAGIALGLRSRAAADERLATVAITIGGVVLALTIVAYTVALVT